MTVQIPIGVPCSQKQDFWKMSVCISKASSSIKNIEPDLQYQPRLWQKNPTNWFQLLQKGHSNYFVKISKNKNIIMLFLYG